jgi:RimJ/RimL family protein N-acetyltransferase
METVIVATPLEHPNSAMGWLTLSAGVHVLVRPITTRDAAALVRFHHGLSERSQFLRYFSPHAILSSDEVAHLTELDGVARFALVVELDGELIAVGRYNCLDDQRRAEVAFVVADAYQHRGIATQLLCLLIDAARSVGITTLVAEVLAENRAMLSVFFDAGFPTTSTCEWGTVEITIDIAPAPTGTLPDQIGTDHVTLVTPPETD